MKLNEPKQSPENSADNVDKQQAENPVGSEPEPGVNPVPAWVPKRFVLAFTRVIPDKWFHQASCEHFNCKNYTEIFQRRADAIAAGYRPCRGCRP